MNFVLLYYTVNKAFDARLFMEFMLAAWIACSIEIISSNEKQMNPVVHCQIKRINGASGDHSILRCLVGLPHPPSVTKSHSGSSLTKTARGLIHKQTTKWTWMETCATSVPSLDLEFQFKQLYIDHFPRGRGSIHLIHPLGSMTSQMWNTRRQLKHFAFYTLKNCFRSWVLIARLNLLHTRFRKKSKITKTNTSWQFYVDMALKHKLLIKCTPAATNLKAKWKQYCIPSGKGRTITMTQRGRIEYYQ